jgi:TetR/AcrR family transcriptional regulator
MLDATPSAVAFVFIKSFLLGVANDGARSLVKCTIDIFKYAFNIPRPYVERTPVVAQTRRKPKAVLDRPSVRERLLDSTASVMIAQDTVDVSLSDIARHADVNVALVSYYFGGKDELMLALAERDAARALAGLDRLMSLDLGPVEKLRRHLIGVIRTFFTHPYLNRLLRALMRDSSTRVAKEIAEFFARPVADAIARLLAEGAESGELRPIDPMLFCFAALGACEHIFSGRAMLRFVFDTKEIDEEMCMRHAEFVADLLMNGCLVRAVVPSDDGQKPTKRGKQARTYSEEEHHERDNRVDRNHHSQKHRRNAD